MITILEPGTLTTVQDIGRTGYQDIGVPESGAVDKFSFRAANLIVGNDENTPGLEITLFGPTLKFAEDTIIAITGANLNPSIDNVDLDNWIAISVSKGSELSFSNPDSGLRAYIAFAGGISVDSIDCVLGSYSTYVLGGFGGLSGRALIAGDTLQINYQDSSEYEALKSKTFKDYPTFDSETVFRILSGPQDKDYLADSIDAFIQNEYSVSIDSDSVGIRLEGEALIHKDAVKLISAGTAFGTIQIPGDGLPIILMSNRGTSGGYLKIATVISADHCKLAQLMPGTKLRFSLTTYEEAIEELRIQEKKLDSLREIHSKKVHTKITASDLLVSVADESGNILSAKLDSQTIIAKVEFGEAIEEIKIDIRD